MLHIGIVIGIGINSLYTYVGKLLAHTAVSSACLAMLHAAERELREYREYSENTENTQRIQRMHREYAENTQSLEILSLHVNLKLCSLCVLCLCEQTNRRGGGRGLKLL